MRSPFPDSTDRAPMKLSQIPSDLVDWSRTQVRERVSMHSRSKLRRAQVRAQMLTHRWRALPSFLIVGAMRAGTSSLFQYLSAHPDVVRAARKEVGYFSLDHERGLPWYRAHFPLRTNMKARHAFEATPDYLPHPSAPQRVAEALPDAHLVVLLRDPAERAFSHYLHCRRLGLEPLSLEEALAAEEERLAPFMRDPGSSSPEDTKRYLRYSYVERGRYGEQLQRWSKHFPREQVHVHFFEDLFADTAKALHTIEGQLGLREWLPETFANHSYTKVVTPRSKSERLTDRQRAHIHDLLSQDRELLREVLERRPPWA